MGTGECTASITFFSNAAGTAVTKSCSLTEHEGEHRTIGATSMYRMPGEPKRSTHRQAASYTIVWSDPVDDDDE